MNFDETDAFRARAAHCSNQAGLVRDTILKKFWDDLADGWMALDNTTLEAENPTMSASLASQKHGSHV